MSGSAWFEDGLRFECTQCGKCCGGAPGTVLLTAREQAGLAHELELSIDEFKAMYTRDLPNGRVSLREQPNHDCIFYNPREGCTVYGQRPRQCRTWPFWRGNLASPAHWAAASEECPGMDQGPLHASAEIESSLEDDGTSGFIPKLSGD